MYVSICHTVVLKFAITKKDCICSPRGWNESKVLRGGQYNLNS